MEGIAVKKLIVVIICLAAFGIVIPCRAKIIFVDTNATGANNGSSWVNAYKYLQDALADATSSSKPVEIRVAQGTYKPDEDILHPQGTGDRAATFQLINGVAIKGGYAGPRMSLSGADPNARDIEKYKSILSGDLAGNDRDVSDPCDLLAEPTRAENIYHIVMAISTDATAVIDGFVLTGGNASGDFETIYALGGGMYNWLGSPSIANCVFSGNSAGGGGGLWNEFSSPIVANCTFIKNAANYGGGTFNTSGYPIFTDCRFEQNLAVEWWWDFGWGGWHVQHRKFSTAGGMFVQR